MKILGQPSQPSQPAEQRHTQVTWPQLLLRMRHTAIMEYMYIYIHIIYIHMLSYTIHKHTNYGEYQRET